MSTGPIQQLLPHRVLLALMLSLLAVTAPHVLHLPPWLSTVLLVCGGWRYLAGSRGWRLPNRWLLLLLTVIGAAGVIAHYGTFIGRDAGVAMLCLMLGLKLLEMRTRRDTVVVLYLGYFLIVTQFLYSQNLLMAAWLLLTVWALTALLITVNRATTPDNWFPHAGPAATLLAQALPLMLVLFVLFPRIPGPLWGMPEDEARGVTGLSDSMTMGSISELSQSDAVAFRVEFDDEPPPPALRYWRGPVLPEYDGRTWRQAERPDDAPPATERLGGEVGYSVTLEPHNRNWIFALDLPVQISIPVSVSGEYALERRSAVRERIRYDVRSALNYRLDPMLRDADPENYLRVPDDHHPRTRALVDDWVSSIDDEEALVNQALNHFREQPFEYTLRPPRLDGDTVDQFLFDSQRGFCEHFAGAFAVMMRMADIPARVVTGYLGGEINPTGNYMIVRQSDAHAWVELWHEGQGWQRVDPTAWVSPDRIDLGLGGAVPEGDNPPALSRRTPSWGRTLALQWDALNAYWDRWVLAYGPDMQRRLMDRLGLGDWQRMILVLTGLMLLSLALLAVLILWRRPARPPDPVQQDWLRFCKRMADAGLPRGVSEGPRDYADRLIRERPDLAAQIDAIARLYVHLRYTERGSTQQAQALRTQIARFRPRTQRTQT